jgi:hypothetical protein
VGLDPPHQLARLHAKQDPRPKSPAEAATDRLRKREDLGEIEKFGELWPKKFPLVHRATGE